MAYDPELWKRLHLGDRVRVIHFPTFEGCLHDDTKAVYEWLVESAHVLTIERLEFVDGQAYPWSDEFEPNLTGIEEQFHWLMLNHDGLELAD